MMAKGGGGERVWRVLNPDFRPCVGDSDHHYLLSVLVFGVNICFWYLWHPADSVCVWCGTSSHRFFVTVGQKKNCGVVCWQWRHHKYLHTAYFFNCILTKDKFIWFLWLKKSRKMLLPGPKLAVPSNEKPYNDNNCNLILGNATILLQQFL